MALRMNHKFVNSFKAKPYYTIMSEFNDSELSLNFYHQDWTCSNLFREIIELEANKFSIVVTFSYRKTLSLTLCSKFFDLN